MRRLIVNADDFGIHPARNRGIAEAVRAGVVNSVSLIANLEGFDDAVELLRALPPVDVGLHFNISEGPAVCKTLRSLVQYEGRFWGKHHARGSALGGGLHMGEVTDEFDCQMDRLVTAGVKPTHVDGHQHIHIYGSMAMDMAHHADRHGLRWTRVPSEPAELSAGLPPDRAKQIEEYRMHAKVARRAFLLKGLRFADHFRGLALSGRMTPERLAELVRSLPEGTTELMVHPGRCCEGSAFDGADREAELAALLSPQFRQALAEGGVELVRRGQVA